MAPILSPNGFELTITRLDSKIVVMEVVEDLSMPITCQRCDKAMATVHLTDLIGGEKKERHLCAECAEDEGVVMKSHQAPLNEILQKFVMQKSTARELADLTCDQCGITFVEFRSHGLLGCPNDYDAFAKALEPLIERSHEGNVQHVGKIAAGQSKSVTTRQILLRLPRELQQAGELEDYEKAARLRDEIQKVESS